MRRVSWSISASFFRAKKSPAAIQPGGFLLPVGKSSLASQLPQCFVGFTRSAVHRKSCGRPMRRVSWSISASFFRAKKSPAAIQPGGFLLPAGKSSLASQLPQCFVGFTRSAVHRKSCGSWLASDLGQLGLTYSLAVDRPGFLVDNKCENTACKSSDALSSSRLSLLSM